MYDKNYTNNFEDKFPFIVVKDEVIIEANEKFNDMTEYFSTELIRRNLSDILDKLRVGPDFHVGKIKAETNYFLFTKSLNVKFFNVQVSYEKQGEKYIFVEKQNFNINEKFPFVNSICSDNYYGIGIYSVPDVTLLKANQKYLSYLDEPFNKMENCIGKHIWEITTGFKGSECEEIWKHIIDTGEVYNIDEYMYEGLNRGITYWRKSIVPIFENNTMMYCVFMTTEITEEVLRRKKIEEQAKIIKDQNYKLRCQADLLNLSREAIFAWNLNGNIVYWNKGAELMYCYSSEEAVGCVSNDLLKTDHSENFDEINNIILKDGIWNGEVEHTKKDGLKLVIETSHQIFIDEYGQKIVLEINRDITERKKLEEEVTNQKKELEEIIQSIDDALFIYDGNKELYLTNNSANKFFEGSNSNGFAYDLNHYKYYDLNGKEIPMEDMAISKIFKGEVVINHKAILKSTNETKYVSVNGRPIYDNIGNIKLAILCSHNVTNDIEAKMRIEEQNKKLEAIIENASDGMLMFNIDHSVTFLNEESKNFVYNIINYKNIGDSYNDTEYFDKKGNNLPIDKTPGVRALKGEKIKDFFVEVRRPDKIFYYSISARPMFDNKGCIISALLCCRDITELVRNEKKIIQQKEQLEAIIENMSDAIMVFDKKGNPTILNAEARKMYPELITKSLQAMQKEYKYFDLDGNPYTHETYGTARAYNGEKVRSEKVVMIGKDSNRILDINASPIFDENKNVISITISHRDITKQIRQHQRLLKSEREKNETMEKAIEMKDDFLSMISHEFKTPINVISTAIQTINYVCAKDLTDNLRKYLNIIRQNTFRQLRLVDNLLDITRADAGRIKIHKANRDMVFLTNSIVESVYTYASQKGVKITFLSSAKKIRIGIDDEKYERILLNLLSNAIKFTPEGKSIKVKLYVEKDNIYIEVRDEGIGIPEDKIEEIFKRFGQVDSSLSRQAEGAGIGLSLVKRFVGVLNGDISVKSKEGKGSTFTIKFPCKEVLEEAEITRTSNLLDNRLVHSTTVEFSDIYF